MALSGRSLACLCRDRIGGEAQREMAGPGLVGEDGFVVEEQFSLHGCSLALPLGHPLSKPGGMAAAVRLASQPPLCFSIAAISGQVVAINHPSLGTSTESASASDGKVAIRKLSEPRRLVFTR